MLRMYLTTDIVLHLFYITMIGSNQHMPVFCQAGFNTFCSTLNAQQRNHCCQLRTMLIAGQSHANGHEYVLALQLGALLNLLEQRLDSARLKKERPDIYEEYVKVSSTRVFRLK